jgi:hypothetical protein
VVVDAVVTDAMGDDPEPVAAGAAVRRVDADDTAGSTAAAPGVEVAFSFACGVGDVEIDGVDEETCPAVGAATTSDCGSAGDVGAETASDVSGAAAFAEPESVPVGSGVGSDAGYSAVPDPAAVVCAASVLCGAPVPGSAGAEDSPDERYPWLPLNLPRVKQNSNYSVTSEPNSDSPRRCLRRKLNPVNRPHPKTHPKLWSSTPTRYPKVAPVPLAAS